MSTGIMSTVRPAVLIAIPAHNEEMLVERCLRSVIKAAESAQRSNTVWGSYGWPCARTDAMTPPPRWHAPS